jgi:predicted MPP superfamily phosphohydrolase
MWRNFLASFVFIIYISKLLTAVVLLFGEIGRGIEWLYTKVQSFGKNGSDLVQTEMPKITRSEFITKTALTLGAAHVGVMTFGILSGAHDYRIRRVKVALKNLPSKFNGIRIAQISDVHSGSFYNKTAVNGGVDLLLNEKPDLAFFTGDLVNNKSEEFKDYFNIFKRIKAPLGVYSTLGNHDYGDYYQWSNPKDKSQNLSNLVEAHRLMGWDLLLDENRSLKVDNEEIGILGIQNWGAGGFAKYGNLKMAMINTDHFPVKLLLSHDPSHWREQVLGKTEIDIAFAGHTHGMQYGVELGSFKWSPVQLRYKEWAGLYSQQEQHLYVNRGYGFIGYPGRVGILPEITIMELVKG